MFLRLFQHRSEGATRWHSFQYRAPANGPFMRPSSNGVSIVWSWSRPACRSTARRAGSRPTVSMSRNCCMRGIAWCRGERHVCSMVVIPSVEEEDLRRTHRERDQRSWSQETAGPCQNVSAGRSHGEIERLAQVQAQIVEVEVARDKAPTPCVATEAQASPAPALEGRRPGLIVHAHAGSHLSPVRQSTTGGELYRDYAQCL